MRRAPSPLQANPEDDLLVKFLGLFARHFGMLKHRFADNPRLALRLTVLALLLRRQSVEAFLRLDKQAIKFGRP